MKHLKSFRIFESKTIEIKQDIEDICLELDDIEFKYSIRETNYYPDEDLPKADSILIEVQDKHQRFFRLEDLQEVIFRLKEYLRDKNFLIDLSIPREDCYMSMDSFFREFSGEELYDLDIYIYYHHRIITESDDINQKIYHQVLDTIKECFLEFEDKGWYWLSKDMFPDSYGTGISVYDFPNFNCRMMIKEDEYLPSELRDYIDWTGEISSDGQINWDTKELDTGDSERGRFEQIKEEAEDFLTAVKRINQELGLDFRFSYNNRGGEKRIIIQGSV